VALEVTKCFDPESTSGDLAPLLAYDCKNEIASLVAVESWSVNGTAGGNATVGTVSGGGATGTYRAPGTAPNPNTVSVTVDVPSVGGGAPGKLYSLITVGTPGPFRGRFDVTGTFALFAGVTVTIPDATLTVHQFPDGRLDDGPDQTLYDVTGTIQIPDVLVLSGGVATCIPASTTKAISNTNLTVHKSPPSMRFDFVDEFELTCTDVGGRTFPSSFYFSYGTFAPGCTPPSIPPPAGWSLLVDYPLWSTFLLDGEFVTTCPTSSASGTWTFDQVPQ
jgi:hypothetical protein